MSLESAPTPTILPPRLKLWARATQWLLALVVSFALLLALFWGLLNWLIVPRIDEFRPAIERLTRQATGLQIQIGELQARSSGLVPAFALRDVRLLDAQGQAALQLPEVLVAISARSLLKRGLEQLVIDGAQLEIKRTADGRFWVAGIDIGSFAPSDPQPLLNWLFSQTEWALLNGTVLWRDEQQGLQTELQQVNWVMRNSGQRHHMRLDATPQTQWGDRISVRGMLRQPLLSGAAGNWRQWSGELYAELGRIEAAPLQAYARLAGLEIAQGRGALRTWIDVERGRVVGALADVQLSQVQAQLGSKLPALALNSVSGRLGWQQLERSTQVRAEALSFESADGMRWPAGNVQWTGQQAPPGQATRSQLSAERIDLQALTALAQRVSLPAPLHEQLRSLQPQGLLETLQMSWVGPLSQPEQMQAQGRVRQLALSAQPAERGPGRPGMQGADVDFQFKRDPKQLSGQASIDLQGGWLELPGVFSEPKLALEGLKTKIKFTHSASASSLEFEPSQLQAQDAQGQFQGSWSRQGGEGLGRLDLQGQLSRADASRVHRYLPLGIPEPVRRYVQSAVSQGQLSDVAFKVKGPVARFPFVQTGDGEFFVNAKLRNARYDYVPSYLAPKAKPWPAFEQLDADLSFNRASLQISNARAQIAGRPGLVMQKTLARIADLGSQSIVEVTGEIRGPVNQGLQLVQSSPLAGMTREVLSQASASGSGELQLRLNLPLRDLDNSTVQGTLQLAGNDVELRPDLPLLAQTRGTVQFTQGSVQVLDAQARVLGGDVRFEGSIRPKGEGGPEALFRGQGQISVEGLKQLRGQPWLSEFARHASGSTSYSATFGLRQGWLEASVQSPLKGLALSLPEPLNKPADAQWPLRIERSMVLASLGPDRKAQDRITLQLGPGPGLAGGLTASYLRDVSGPTPQVLAGDIALGSAPRELLGGQVRAQIQWPSLDLDAWDDAGSGLWESSRGLGPGYLPTAVILRSPQVRLQGHTLQQVALNFAREGALWRGTIEASEVNGQAEYRPPSAGNAGRLYARLSRLSLGQVTSNSVENLLDKQPASMPALDIVVDELDLRGRKLGRLEIEALNRSAAQGAREWRLAKLILSVPEARLTANGSWAAQPTGAAPARTGEAALRRNTQMTFRLDINDSGELLKRLGMDGAIRRGKGKLEGQIGWSGSPLSLHTPSMTGQFTVDVESGQFLKAEPGVAKLLGVLNLQALPRRLTLDFRDVFSEGFSFDWVRGEVSIDQGVARTDSLRMKGVNAAVLLAGAADIGRETQDLRVVVVPEINAGTASLLASAINPAVGLGTFIAQWLLRRPINEATTQEFLVRGTWADPVIERVNRRPAAAVPQTP
jgi:uncharacterized protein (TIGR02099 family)